MKFNKFLSGALAAAMAVVMIPSTAASAETYSLPGGGQKSGDLGGGYHYELWIDSTGGNGSMTVNSSGGEFDAVWDCSVPRGNYLARNGKLFDRKKKATECGTITMDYEASYQQTGSNNGNSRLCVYGWMIEPSTQEVIEYYIIEDWVNWVPSPDGSFAAKTVNIDGGDYDIFWIWHEGPTIKGGSERFKQYFSVRKNKRTSGRITVSDHFAEWEKAGMKCFNLTEVALNAEGYQSSGRANVTKNEITVGTPKPTEPTEPPTEPPTDESGYYFHSTFEDGLNGWAERGEDKVASSGDAKYKGSKSAAVTDLTDYWNGLGRTLDPSVFKPGNAYSFSAMAMQNTTASEHFKLSLEYNDASGTQSWDTIAEADGSKGEWVQLENTEYTIPAGASGMTLYVETDETTTPFFVDEAVGGVKGAKYTADVVKPTEPVTDLPTQDKPVEASMYGDVDLSKKVDILDVITLNKSLMVGEKLSDQAKANADVDRNQTINEVDSLNILKHIVELVDALPVGEATVNPKEDPTEAPTEAPKITGQSYMSSLTVDPNLPAGSGSKKGGINYSAPQKITYHSTVANRDKEANVVLPPDYDPSKKYPVMYVNHGIMGGCGDLLGEGWGIEYTAANLAAEGKAKPMILVFTSMYTNPNSAFCSGVTLEECKHYDAFREDLIECLMPYINEHYSTATGRENTAVCGFSMGGRESLYIGITKPEIFGYVACGCPAPGVTPGTDFAGNHPGNMQESELKITDAANQPYVLFLAGGTGDTVVGQFPQNYHNILTANGQEHLWLEIPGGGHDASVVAPMMYNFLQYAFKG